MSLPFADKPEDSSIYQDLRVTKLVDITASDFDAFRARMDAQGTEGLEDEYRRLLLLGLASNQVSLSGPLGNTQFVSQSTLDDDGFYTNFTPSIGEVWQIVGISATLATGITRIEFKIKDDVTSVYVEVGQADGTGASELEGYPILVGYPCSFVSHARGTYSSGTNYTYISAIRVR